MRTLLLVGALALAACDGNGTDLPRLNVSELSQDPALLVGTWDLASVTSSGFGGPVTTTPAAGLDWSASYTFRADGTVDVYRDGQLEETTGWLVTAPGGDLSPSLRIGTEESFRREYFGVTPSRLYFDSRPADGPLLEFARR